MTVSRDGHLIDQIIGKNKKMIIITVRFVVTFREGGGCDWDEAPRRVPGVAGTPLFLAFGNGYRGVHLIMIH